VIARQGPRQAHRSQLLCARPPGRAQRGRCLAGYPLANPADARPSWSPAHAPASPPPRC